MYVDKSMCATIRKQLFSFVLQGSHSVDQLIAVSFPLNDKPSLAFPKSEHARVPNVLWLCAHCLLIPRPSRIFHVCNFGRPGYEAV